MKSILVRSLSTILVGGLLVAFPQEAAVWLIRLIGVLFLAPGIYSLLAYWMLNKQGEYKPLFPLVGLGSAILGMWMVFMPDFFVETIMLALSVVLMVASAWQLASAWKSRQVAQVPLAFYVLPALLFAAALFVLCYPGLAAAVPFYIIGVSMMVYGVLEAIGYFWLQQKLKLQKGLHVMEEPVDAEIISEEKIEKNTEDL